MKTVQIQAYTFDELDARGKVKALYWLDECPFEYEDEHGSVYYEYPSEWQYEDISEHCNMNEYIFNKYGEPIHHLIIETESEAA